MPESLAIYTTAYPAARRWLPDWATSLAGQTDRHGRLWMALDGVEPEEVRAWAALPASIEFIRAEPGESNAALRFRAMAAMIDAHAGVVFVDCDDLMHPDRVAAARVALDSADVVACALRLVDAGGRPLGITFGPRTPAAAAGMLPHWNVFGLSNTAWQAGALRDCIPGPAECELVDWYLATRAWLGGADLRFDPTVHMDYRRHGDNLAPVEGPFSAEGVRRATELVVRHHDLMAAAAAAAPGPRAEALQAARDAVAAFHARVVDRTPVLEAYVVRLNALPPDPVWWWMVANPALEALWTN